MRTQRPLEYHHGDQSQLCADALGDSSQLRHDSRVQHDHGLQLPQLLITQEDKNYRKCQPPQREEEVVQLGHTIGVTLWA